MTGLFDSTEADEYPVGRGLMVSISPDIPRVLLSICIPTYARRDKLDALLTSLCDQDLSEVEICISENASGDGTSELVAVWASKLPIFYHCWPENVGYDRNLLKVVEMAHGEYCWLIGSDDLVAPGALSRLKAQLIGCRPPGLVLGCTSFDLTPPAVPELELPIVPLHPLVDRQLMVVAPLFGLLSVQVFQTQLWREALKDGRWRNRVGRAYLHLYMVLKMAVAVGKWYQDAAPFLLYRTASFGDQVNAFGSVHRRLLHEVQEASVIIKEICPPRSAKEMAAAGIKRDLLRNLSVWRVSGLCREQRAEMEAALRMMPSPGPFYWLIILAILKSPLVVMVAAHKAARAIRRTLAPILARLHGRSAKFSQRSSLSLR